MKPKVHNPEKSEENIIPQIDLNIKIGNFLNSKGTFAFLIEQIKTKLNQNDVHKLDKIIMNLILNVHLKTENFNAPLYTNLIVDLIEYILEERKNNTNPNIVKIYNIISNYFSEDPLLRILFEQSVDLLKNEEVEIYLDLLIPFILDKQLNLITNSLQIYFDENVTKHLDTLFKDIDIESPKTFDFLKQLLLKIINIILIKRVDNKQYIKLKENIIDEIKNFVNDYYNLEKNEFLRCKICADFPILILDKNKKISMKYSCSHNQENVINSYDIQNSKLKCAECQNEIHYIKKNYLCSNCKHIICFQCKQNHFIKCLTIFLIKFSDIGLICHEHNTAIETFCSICNKNLCLYCKEEHEHFSNYSAKSTSKEFKNKIDNYIKSCNDIEKPYITLIKLIISDDKYLANFQFEYFLNNLLGEKSEHKCGFFEKFGNKEFNEYYSTLIQEFSNGNYYYIQIYENIRSIYEENKRKINEHNFNYITWHLNDKKESKIYIKNGLKAALLANYFINLFDIKNNLNHFDCLIKNDDLKIKKEQNKMNINILLFENSKYKSQIVKLLNRTIADYILRYLVIEYLHKFSRITLDLKLYNDIKEYFKGDKKFLLNFEKSQKDIINQLLDNAKNKLNNYENINEEKDIFEDYNNEIIFCEEIEIKNKTLTVKNLNLILEYLFNLKEVGDSIANRYKGNFALSKNENETHNINEQNNKKIKFIDNLTEFFKNLELKKPISKKTLLEGLFESKYDKILSIIKDKEINQILEMEENINDSRIDVELSDEFRKIEGILSSFKSNYNSLLSYKNCKSSKIDKTTFKDFYSLLYKSINEKESKESILNLLRNILNFEYGNCLLGNIPSFIQGCLDYIINYIVEIDKDTIISLENQIEEKMKKRRENKILLKLYKKLSERTKKYELNEDKKNQNENIIMLVDLINRKKTKNEKHLEYYEGTAIYYTIMEHLELLLKDNLILWPNYKKQKLSSLLCLYQNQN